MITKYKTLTVALATLLCSLTTNLTAITITSFGTATNPTWSDSGFTDFTVDSQGAGSISFTGTDTNSLSGDVPMVDLSSIWGNDLEITGSITTNPGSTFGVILFDQEFDQATFSGGSWTDLVGGSTVLSFVSASGSFNTTQVIGIDIVGGGAGDALSATLTGAAIVPEPSAYAALAGLLALGAVMVRRRA
tara:strand:+ start:112 stop:681 length:570 start_codon:yes stop_codon:yes gene_type:complete